MNYTRTELQLSRGRIRPLFLRYATPGVVAMVFLALQSIADGFIVGRLISPYALAAVNIACPAYTIVTAVSMIIGVGTQAQMGLHAGAEEYGEVRSAFMSGFWGVLFFALLGALFINVFATEVARFLGANDELLPDTIAYIHGVMPWLLGIGLHVFFDDTLKALGHPRFAMATMVGVIVLNVVLSTIFVYVCHMGTFGAGLGTGISFTLGGLVTGGLSWWEFRANEKLSRSRGPLSLRTLGHIFYNGSSEGLTELSFGITTFLFNITLMHYAGKAGVAAFTLVNYILFVGISVMLGISNGVIPIISYNHGAERLWRVKAILKTALGANIACGLAFILVIWVLGRSIVGLFVAPEETAVLALTVHGARIVAFEFLFCSLSILTASYFTAIDKPGLSLLVSGSRSLALPVIGVLVLPLFLGVEGVWLAIIVSEALTFILSLSLLRGRRLRSF